MRLVRAASHRSRRRSRHLVIAALLAATVAPAAAQGAAPVNTASPVITGEAKPNGLLTCSPGTWTGEPVEYTFAWRDNGVLTQFTDDQARVDRQAGGHQYTCTVTALAPSGPEVSSPATSAPVQIETLPDAAPTLKITPATRTVRKGRKVSMKLTLLCPAGAREYCQGQIQFKGKESSPYPFGYVNVDLVPGKRTTVLLPLNPAVAAILKETRKLPGILIAKLSTESTRKATTKKKFTLRY